MVSKSAARHEVTQCFFFAYVDVSGSFPLRCRALASDATTFFMRCSVDQEDSVGGWKGLSMSKRGSQDYERIQRG